MRALRDLPFRLQLALVVTLTSGLAVGLAALGTLGFERRQAYSDMRSDSLALARVLASNSEAALAFDDARAGQGTLAVLAIKPQVTSAQLFTRGGRPLASYRRPGADSDLIPASPGPPGHRFEGNHLVIVEPVDYDGETVGSLYLKVETRSVASRLWRAALVLGLVFLAATALALLASARLQASVGSQSPARGRARRAQGSEGERLRGAGPAPRPGRAAGAGRGLQRDAGSDRTTRRGAPRRS